MSLETLLVSIRAGKEIAQADQDIAHNKQEFDIARGRTMAYEAMEKTAQKMVNK